MKIASAVAGFTLGEADVLRAAMGKKDKVKMAKQREQFLSGAAARGVAAETALELFELIAQVRRVRIQRGAFDGRTG